MREPLVSIIIVNWNGEDVISDCLTSVFCQKYKHIEVIVVDNNSTDGSITKIKTYKNVILIRNKKNLGFAEGNNIGSKKAKGKYILLLNNDTIVTDNFLFPLVTVLEKDPTVAVAQPKILYKGSPFYKDGVINSIGSFFTSTGFLYHLGYGKNPTLPLYNSKRAIFSAFGACMLIRADVIKEIGLFDQEFFAYFEETDFCVRTWLHGYKVMYEPLSTIYHKGGVSARKYGTPLVQFHSFKNRICSFIKNFETGTLLVILPIHLLICELTAFLYLFMLKPAFFLAIQKAVLWNILSIRDTLKKRRILQKQIRRKKDISYLRNVWVNPHASYYYYLLRGLEYYHDRK